jgi:hypothetical protein
MSSKVIDVAMTSDNKQDKQADKMDGKFVKKNYLRSWEVELTEEQKENLKKSIEEDEKKYEAMGKRLAEDRSFSELFNKIKK